MTTEHSYAVPVWKPAEAPGIELRNDLEYIGQQFEFDGALGNSGKHLEVNEAFGPRFTFVTNYPWLVESSLTRRGQSKTCSVKQASRPGILDTGYQDSTYGSLTNDDTESCMSFSNNLAPAIEQLRGIGGYSSCSREQLVPTRRSSIRCDLCNWEGKLLSEKRKHDARHRRDHRCQESDCSARFGSLNDLERHRKSKHKQLPERGPHETFKCFGRDCSQSEKIWPRLDNFKTHLKRIHKEQDEEELLSESRKWYQDTKNKEKVMKEKNLATDCTERTPSIDIQLGTQQEPDQDNSSTRATRIDAQPANFSSRETTEQSLPRPEAPKLQKDIGCVPEISEATKMKPPKIPAKCKSPGLESFDRGACPAEKLALADKLYAKVKDLPESAIKSVLNFALHLEENQDMEKADEATKEPEFTGGYLCPQCCQVLKTPAEMKKHERRHEKPYVCTFPNCYKRFGSKADWKRHESTLHCVWAQLFRCSLPGDSDSECAAVFSREEEFVKHLDSTHLADAELKREQLLNNRIGQNPAGSRFSYWCGFCKSIEVVNKAGVEASNTRFDHIASHIEKGAQINQWISVNGHLDKGALEQIHKKRKSERDGATSSSGSEDYTSSETDESNNEQLSDYDRCPASTNDGRGYSESSPRHKARKLNRAKPKGYPVFYCHCCSDGPYRMELFVNCSKCDHQRCPQCEVDTIPVLEQTIGLFE